MLTADLSYDIKTVREIVLRYLQAFRAQVYLFGSQATGAASQYSDIDIGILPLEPLPDDILSNIRQEIEESNILRHADIVDLSEVDETFLQRVTREGILWKE